MMDAFAAHIDFLRAQGLQAPYVDIEEGALRVLQGREDQALTLWESAYKKGWREAFAEGSAILALLEDKARLNRLFTQIKTDLDRERDKLGYGLL